MVQSIILIIVLVLGAILYIVLRNRVTELEQRLNAQDSINVNEHELLVKLYNQVTQLTDGHNEVANVLNEMRQNPKSVEYDDYMPFKTPKGEA